MGELETHYKRLCRVSKENPWKKGFGLVGVVLLGGVVGAALAGPGWTWEVKTAALLAVVSGIAWKAIAETESESIRTISDDYKEDILDSLVLEPIGTDLPPGAHTDSRALTAKDLDEWVESLTRELEKPDDEEKATT
jgi:hypothetical protein